MTTGFTANGQEVLDPSGGHFADAASPVAALLIVCSLELRRHRPTIEGDRVICSRCQSELPHEGAEPCIARTPRCSETPDMFDSREPDGGQSKMPLQKAG